jgi:thiol-disulfide isomerase/thioredoxin
LIYLANTSNLKIDVDYKDFDKTITFGGNGADENNFLLKFSKEAEAKFTGLLSANDQTELENGIAKIKTDIATLLPTTVSKSFKDSFNGMVDGQFDQIKEMAKQSIESKKMNGKPSPVFDYANHKGGRTKLADLTGKLVYIDVWATWCGPCIGEIPSLKKVEAQYHDKNIEFVSISVDDLKDNEKWKNMVTKKELGGIQLFADNSWSSDFVKAYGINSIPRFILIGANGDVISADAPRPSDPKLIALIDENLKKSK